MIRRLARLWRRLRTVPPAEVYVISEQGVPVAACETSVRVEEELGRRTRRGLRVYKVPLFREQGS